MVLSSYNFFHDNRLRNFRQSVLRTQGGCRTAECTDARTHIIFYAQLVQLVKLLADRAENAGIARMQTHRCFPDTFGALYTFQNLFQRHFRTVADLAAFFCIFQNRRIHQRTGIYDQIRLTQQTRSTNGDAIDPAAAEHTTQFDAIDPAAAEHTTQFDAIDPAAAEHTTQFDAIDPAVPTVDEKDAAPDLPTLPAEKPELPIAPPPLPPVLPTEVRGEKSAEEEITSESGDLETIEEPDELSDAKTEEKAVLPSEDAVVLPVAEETVEASPPSLSDEPGELTEQTTTFDVTRVTDADLVSAVMRLISDAGNPPSDEVRESSNRRHLEDVTVIDDWHTPEKKQEDGRSAEEGEA